MLSITETSPCFGDSSLGLVAIVTHSMDLVAQQIRGRGAQAIQSQMGEE